jgi:succinyldiaminopimelate transaminase
MGSLPGLGPVATLPLSPVLREQATYPFVRLTQAAGERAARGLEVIDLGMGDPQEPTDPQIIEALRAGVRERMGYPAAVGLPELREAITGWISRRFAVELDPAAQVIPTLGSKEAIFTFAPLVLDQSAGKDTIVVTEPGYPVPERGALFAGARVVALPLREEHGFLPALDGVDEDDWRRAALVWVNYPNNPTGVTTTFHLYEQLARLARQHGFVLASDEAYSELWFDEPPVSALQLVDLTNVAVFNSLSKRSSMTGYRSGFVAGDDQIVAALRRFRPNLGTAPQEFVQRASVVAWGDEKHVERARSAYRRKRRVFVDLFERKGIRVAGGSATMYVWIAVPGDEPAEEFAAGLLEHGVVVAPGSYLGPSGEGYARLALVPTLADCERAAEILEDVL